MLQATCCQLLPWCNAAFSRNPIRLPPVLSALVITADNWLKITQRRDPETQEIKLKLTEGKLTTEYFCHI
jgi:hypothetical protein